MTSTDAQLQTLSEQVEPRDTKGVPSRRQRDVHAVVQSVTAIATAVAVVAGVVFAVVQLTQGQATLELAVAALEDERAAAAAEAEHFANEVPDVRVAADDWGASQSSVFASTESAEQGGWDFRFYRALVSNVTQSRTTLTGITVDGGVAAYFYGTNATGGYTSSMNEPISIGAGESVYVGFFYSPDVALADESTAAWKFIFAGDVDVPFDMNAAQSLLPAGLVGLESTSPASSELKADICRIGFAQAQRELKDPYWTNDENIAENCDPDTAP